VSKQNKLAAARGTRQVESGWRFERIS